MKRLITILFVCACALTSGAQRLSSNDSLQIHSMIEDWDRAWNEKDYSLAAKWYSSDASFTNAFGDKRMGRKEVEALLKEVFSLPFVMAGQSETTEHRFQVLSYNTVIVHTAVLRKGQKMPDGSVLPDRKTTHLRVFGRENAGWVIKAHLISDARDKQSPKH
ncbi:MAG: YybH family protein [Chitinophagaceae bacterium]